MILVTGGAGFIGSHLVCTLVAAGHAVRVFELPAKSVEHLPLEEVEIVRGDVRDRGAVESAVRGCRLVYHLAADPNLWRRRRSDFDDINHRGTVHVLDAALEAGAERILHASTESILTSRQFRGGAVEELVLHEADMIGPYCLSKYKAESAAFALARRGAPVIVASPTLPIGPGDLGRTPPTRMTVDFCRGKLPAYLDCRFNVIDARDVALGMIRALERGRPGRRYLLGGENLRLAEWLTLVARLIGRRPPRWKVPYPVALAVACVSEFLADHCTGRMPNATITGVRLTRRVMHFDPSATLRELDLEPRPVTESIRDALAWYRSLGWI